MTAAAARVARTVIEAIREEALFKERLPYPHDDDAEHDVASAVLEGYYRPEDIDGLDASDFHLPDVSAIYAVALSCREMGVEPTDARVLATLESLGYRGDILGSIERVRNSPARIGVQLRRRTERVIDLARARRALVHLGAAESALRALPDQPASLPSLAATLQAAAAALTGAGR